MLLPEPRAVIGVFVSAAQRTNRVTSSVAAATATARGMMRPMPAASE
jgi:hypothetical protein